MAIVGLLSDEQTVARAVTLFSALGDRSRLIIIRELARGGSIRVGELVTRLGLAQGTVSGHLAVLRYSGLVTVEVQRNHRLYSLAHSQTLDLVSLAEQLLSGPPNS
ncbi:MAG TPA: transcriptional regulator [Micromonosporaceae bacterium]|nr:transcriptional regulator [Micromonosporaceae bacterium]HCU49916.1 transcriptional regulator [Micromonosporaceae bacterium]